MPTTMNRGRTVTFAWLIVAAPLFGCGGDAAPTREMEEGRAGQPGAGGPPGVAARGQERADKVSLTADSARGRFQIRIRPEGGDIPLNEPFAVTVDLFDPATGARFEDYDSVALDARMPAHGHGMLRDVDLVPTEGGGLRAEGLLFHMIGHWEFHVDITRGLRIERAQASYELTL